jgi:hypothetical protein
MNKHTWSDDERTEYELLVSESLRVAGVIPRRDIFLAGLDDAEQAHRIWARDVIQDMRSNGADRILKNEQNARTRRVAVAHNGQVLGKVHREVGARKRDDEGAVENQRLLFDFMSWEQLREKLPWYAQQIGAFERDAMAVVRLLELEDRVPDAANPAEACERLGITVEQWLLGEDAA